MTIRVNNFPLYFWESVTPGLNEWGVIRSREESLMSRGECSGSHSCLDPESLSTGVTHDYDTGRCVRSSVGPGFDSVESFLFFFFLLSFFKTKPHTK